MAEEITAPVEGMEQDYLATIQELKNSTVSREAYDKMRDENKKLLETIINGGQMEAPAENTNIDYKAECSKLLTEGKHTNLDYVKKALEIRNAGLKEGVDMAMPFGPKAEYSENDTEIADFVANKLQELVDKADGNPSAFNFLLDQAMVDNMPARGPGRRNIR
jgi:hypothetical protein